MTSTTFLDATNANEATTALAALSAAAKAMDDPAASAIRPSPEAVLAVGSAEAVAFWLRADPSPAEVAKVLLADPSARNRAPFRDWSRGRTTGDRTTVVAALLDRDVDTALTFVPDVSGEIDEEARWRWSRQERWSMSRSRGEQPACR